MNNQTKECWLVDLMGNMFKSTIGFAARQKLHENGWVLCKDKDQADRLSKQIQLLRWKDGFQSSPFDKMPVENGCIFVNNPTKGGSK